MLATVRARSSEFVSGFRVRREPPSRRENGSPCPGLVPKDSARARLALPRPTARALVSDIVAYHPQLREQGLREGTIKVLLKDEIKKSYEEYVDQVGREFAESTMHFQDALNEILASGRKLF